MKREKVLALRARGHGLATRFPDAALVGAVGLRSTKHSALSVRARVADVPADALDRSLVAGDPALAAECVPDPSGTVLAESPGSTESVAGVRFLPPYDPYLLDRDRATLVPDRAAQNAVWRAVGGPGLLLVDGEPVGHWKTRRREMQITPFRPGFRCDVDAELQYMFGDMAPAWTD